MLSLSHLLVGAKIRQNIEKAFNEFGMHKIYSYVFCMFQNEIDLLKRSGFKLEALLEKESLDKHGNYIDLARFCIINE